jgi:hypothetical protein
MLTLLMAAAAATTPPAVNTALDLCRPVLATKAGGEISAIEVTSFHLGRKDIAINGRLIAFLGMGPPPPGSASAHHLIRAQFTYRCTVQRARVRSASVAPLQ